jgi:hypothetical protein
VLALALSPMVLPIGVIVVERVTTGRPAWAAGQRAACAVLALGGLACTLTLLASPKIGPRLYFASVALITAGLTGWITAQLRSTWARGATAAAAAALVAYVVVRLVAIHQVVGPLGALRRDRIEHGAPGAVVTVPRYPIETSRYFLGEDFTATNLREAIAGGYHLKAVELAPAASR